MEKLKLEEKGDMTLRFSGKLIVTLAMNVMDALIEDETTTNEERAEVRRKRDMVVKNREALGCDITRWPHEDVKTFVALLFEMREFLRQYGSLLAAVSLKELFKELNEAAMEEALKNAPPAGRA